MKQTDYRVIHWHKSGTDTYAIYQVYYDDHDNIAQLAEFPVKLEALSPEALKDQHFHIAGAYLQPVVEGHLFKTDLQPKVTETLDYVKKMFK